MSDLIVSAFRTHAFTVEALRCPEGEFVALSIHMDAAGGKTRKPISLLARDARALAARLLAAADDLDGRAS